MTVETDTRTSSPASAATAWVRVLFFGRIADVCGRSLEISVPSQGCSLGDLKARIAGQVSGGAAACREPGIRGAIDQVMAGGDVWVTPGQDVAFRSAFSGG
jgi:molybdopterin converting factor small subunit